MNFFSFFVRTDRTVHSNSKSLRFINIGAAVTLWQAYKVRQQQTA